MHPALVAVLSVIGALLFCFLVVMRIVRKARPVPMAAFAVPVLDNPLRRLVQRPSRTLERMGIGRGMRVLELGPGAGFFSVEAARRVGGTGILCSVDIAPSLVARLKGKVAREGTGNWAAVVGDGQRLPFADASFDHAFLVTVLGEIPDKEAALGELHRVLAPGGVLSVCEMLPDPDYCLASTTIGLCRGAGFEVARRWGNFFVYTINFRRDGQC